MTVQELMRELEGCEPDAEVRIAQQPSWPFEYSISQVVEAKPVDESDDDDSDPVVYIAEGMQLAYLPAEASMVLGWR
jgi:hypothetical protein